MVKQRLIAVVYIKESRAVQSFSFNNYRVIGDPVIACRYLSEWGADEIAVIDIDRQYGCESFDLDLLSNIAKVVDCPLAVGGGIDSYDVAAGLIEGGADKLIVNSLLRNDLAELSRISRVFGAQSIIASVDVVKCDNNYYWYDYANNTESTIALDSILHAALQSGCGELLLNQVMLDGSGLGFDCSFYTQISNKFLGVPIIACGGAGKVQDISAVLQCGMNVSAAAGNIFYHTEVSYFDMKNCLYNDLGCNVRQNVFCLDGDGYGC